MKQKQKKAKIPRFTFDMNCVDVLAKNKKSAAHKFINYSVPSRSLSYLSFPEEFSLKDRRQKQLLSTD